MILTQFGEEYSEGILSTIADAAHADQPPRSKGLHLSEIIKDICQQLQPKRFADKDKPPLEWWTPGTIWEVALERSAKELFLKGGVSEIVRPGEVIMDGIACSPDAIDIRQWELHEFKFTWMSSREAPEHKKFWHWMVQIRAYCYALQVKTAILHAFFVMGDYRGSGPQALAWRIEFTDLELRETWEMIVNHAKSKGWI